MASANLILMKEYLQKGINSADLTNSIISLLNENELFLSVADIETRETIQRDIADGEKLQKGIDLSVAQGVLEKKDFTTIQANQIHVLPDSMPKDNVEKILNSIDKKSSLITIYGKSGTGKGTAVELLIKEFVLQGKKVMTWSNGNIFRSLTYLAHQYLLKKDIDFNEESRDQYLDGDVMNQFADNLEFSKNSDDQFDIHVLNKDLAVDFWVSQEKNNLLKVISPFIPMIAEITQGIVINFAKKCFEQLYKDGFTIVLEGREQTLNYFETSNRFELILDDSSLIGKRRVAQVIVQRSIEKMKKKGSPDINSLLLESLNTYAYDKGIS